MVFLYKYTKCNDFLIQNLSNHHLWTSFVYRLNDLFEMNISVKKSTNIDDNNHLIEELNKIMKSLSICSLSESNTNLKMWAHYSDCHRGVCLEYPHYKILQRFTDNNLFKVFYANKEYEISAEQSDQELLHTCISAMCTKSTIWEEEEEWRIIIDKPSDNEYGNYLKHLTPSKVYLGCRIDEENRKQIISICMKHGIEVKQMVKEKNGINTVNVDSAYRNELGQWLEKE